jgi:hypothetical protein
MSEADLFRHYAKEAMRESSEVTSENEKRSLIDLACTWVQAALMSDRAIESLSTRPAEHSPCRRRERHAGAPDECSSH